MLVELVPLRRLGAEQGAPAREQVGTLEVVLLLDQEVLLLGPDRGVDALDVLAEQLQRLGRRARQRVHRAQERDLVVQRLTGPGDERGRDAEDRAVRVLHDERRRGRVPGGVATRLEGGAQAAGRERRGVRLALDQRLAGELGDRLALRGGRVEGVVLLGGQPRQRLEPVRVVGRALLHRPGAHRLRDVVGQRRVHGLARLESRHELLEDVLGHPCPLLGDGEHVGAELVGARLGQVVDAQRAAVECPAGGGDVVLTGSHASASCLLSEAPPR